MLWQHLNLVHLLSIRGAVLRIDDVKWQIFEVVCGVPQGSILARNYFCAVQCSSRNTGVMCSLLRVRVIRRAAHAHAANFQIVSAENLAAEHFHRPSAMLPVPGPESCRCRQ